MADLRPFRAVHYDPGRVPLADALAPPYDVISPEEREILEARSPYNIIHLILGQSHIGSGLQAEDRYAAAGHRWREWREAGALTQEETLAFYVYEQRFLHEGESFARTGLVAAVRLEPYASGVIFPHEQTFPGPKQDRRRLMEAVDANLDSVFGLYDGRMVTIEGLIDAARSSAPLLASPSPDGQTHRIWAIQEPQAIEAIRSAFTSAPIVIADGHHRYETALAYRDKRRAAGDTSPALDYVMMTLCSIQDPGLLVLPTHRLVKGLEGETPVATPGEPMAHVVTLTLSNAFQTQSAGSGSHTLDRLERLGREGRSAYGAYFGEDAGYLLISKSPAAHRYEEVSRFRQEVLDRLPGTLEVDQVRVDYTHSSAEALCQVNAGNAWIAFLLQGLPVSEVYEAARAGLLLPEKSTYFHPKLQSGLLMRALDEER